MDKKIIVDLADNEETYLRLKINAKDFSKLKKIVKQVQKAFDDYNTDDIEQEIEKQGLQVEYIPLEADKYIYF